MHLCSVIKGLLIIFGAGGHARVVLDALRLSDRDRVRLASDELQPPAVPWFDRPVIAEARKSLLSLDREISGIVPAIGSNPARMSIIGWAEGEGLPLISIVHENACVSNAAKLGNGCFVAAGAVIGAGTTLGRGAIVNTGATVDHDCHLGDGVHIGPGSDLCGGVNVGAETLIGVGSAIAPGLEIGAGTTIGAGSVVVRSIPPGRTAYGNPARIVP